MGDSVLNMMSAESKLLADLNDFNAKYANYVQCTNSASITKTNSSGATCTVDDMNIQTVNDAYNKLVTYTTSNGTNTLTGGDVYRVLNTNLNNAPSKQQYNDSYDYVTKTYNSDVLKMRGELDAKMRELYATPDSRMFEYKQSYDSTIYAGILWTILATTGLYFVFTKL
jgi:hypothetical protein